MNGNRTRLFRGHNPARQPLRYHRQEPGRAGIIHFVLVFSDGLAVIDDALGIPRIEGCLPPHVPVPKPGPCPGTKRGPRSAVKQAVKKATATPKKKPAAKTPPAPSGPQSRRKPGRNIEAAMKKQFGKRTELPYKYQSHDPYTTALNRKQAGWNDPAEVVTPQQLDEAIASGWTEVWRGVRGGSLGKTAAQLAEDTRTGPWELSSGVFGSGTYASARRTTAESFRATNPTEYLINAKLSQKDPSMWGPPPLSEYQGPSLSPPEPGGLMRMAIDPAAKIVDWKDLKKEMFDWLLADNNMSKPWSIDGQNAGFWATMRGYDVIRVPSGPHITDGAIYPTDDQPAADQYIILNRSVVKMEEASDRYGR